MVHSRAPGRQGRTEPDGFRRELANGGGNGPTRGRRAREQITQPNSVDTPTGAQRAGKPTASARSQGEILGQVATSQATELAGPTAVTACTGELATRCP